MNYKNILNLKCPKCEYKLKFKKGETFSYGMGYFHTENDYYKCNFCNYTISVKKYKKEIKKIKNEI